MKRILRVLTVYIGICFVFNFVAQPLPGNDMDRFQIKADGTVTIDGKVFASLSQYIRSDYFKTSGKRCGTRIRSLRSGPSASTGDSPGPGRMVVVQVSLPATELAIM